MLFALYKNLNNSAALLVSGFQSELHENSDGFHRTTCGFLSHPKAEISDFSDQKASRISVRTKYFFFRCTWVTNLEPWASQVECLGAWRAPQNFYSGDQLWGLGTLAKMLWSPKGSLKFSLEHSLGMTWLRFCNSLSETIYCIVPDGQCMQLYFKKSLIWMFFNLCASVRSLFFSQFFGHRAGFIHASHVGKREKIFLTIQEKKSRTAVLLCLHVGNDRNMYGLYAINCQKRAINGLRLHLELHCSVGSITSHCSGKWARTPYKDNTQVLIFSFFKNGLKDFLAYYFIQPSWSVINGNLGSEHH